MSANKHLFSLRNLYLDIFYAVTFTDQLYIFLSNFSATKPVNQSFENTKLSPVIDNVYIRMECS